VCTCVLHTCHSDLSLSLSLLFFFIHPPTTCLYPFVRKSAWIYSYTSAHTHPHTRHICKKKRKRQNTYDLIMIMIII
jgi:hypothetical protein